jgi:hypothetical protein
VALLDRRCVLLQDELVAKKADMTWFMHTAAQITLAADGRSATLSQGGVKLQARIVAPRDARFEVRPASPFASSPNPKGQRSNGDFRKLAIHLGGAGDVRLAVVFVPLDGATDPAWMPKIKPLADW